MTSSDPDYAHNGEQEKALQLLRDHPPPPNFKCTFLNREETMYLKAFLEFWNDENDFDVEKP